MNCRRTRELLSPYSDGRLTGAQMLEVAQHMNACHGCRDEYRVIQEVKILLRSVSRPQPSQALEREIRKRVATEEAISQINLCLSFSVRPQRAKRMATAVALSCISVFAVAAPFGAGTIALSYTQAPNTHMPFSVAISPRQDARPVFGKPENANDYLLANSDNGPLLNRLLRRQSPRDGSYGVQMSRDFDPGVFANPRVGGFGADASFVTYVNH